MQTFSVRPSIYQPQMVFGLRLSNWPWILGVSGLALIIPFVGGWRIGPVPLALFCGVGALGASALFFKWAQTGRRPRWLENTLAAVAQPQRRRRRRYGERRHKSFVRPA